MTHHSQNPRQRPFLHRRSLSRRNLDFCRHIFVSAHLLLLVVDTAAIFVDSSFDSLKDVHVAIFDFLRRPCHPSIFIPSITPDAKTNSSKAFKFDASAISSSVKSSVAPTATTTSFGVSGAPPIFGTSLTSTSTIGTTILVVFVHGFVPSKSLVPPTPSTISCSNDDVFFLMLRVIFCMIFLALTLSFP